MAERCGNVADGNIMGGLEATVKPIQSPQGPKDDDRHLGSSSSQRNDGFPLEISNYPDHFRSLGWKRLLPIDVDDSDVFPSYQTYLKKFYHLHKNRVDHSITDAALKCLMKENNLRLCWLALKVNVNPSDACLSNHICNFMLELFQNGGKSEGPFVIDAAACIMKEARLIMKLQRQGFHVPYSQYNLSRNIRRLALKVAMFQGKWSPEIAALLLGITKEADEQLSLLKNMSGRYLDAIGISSQIRKFALEFLSYKFDEIENDEMTSDVEPTCGLATEFEKTN